MKGKNKISYICILLMAVLFLMPMLHLRGYNQNNPSNERNYLNSSQKTMSLDNLPHLTFDEGEDGGIIVSYGGTGPFYDETMSAFHELEQCHSVTKGYGTTVLIIDSPIDYRHDIFDQEGYSSLLVENCYRIKCLYSPDVEVIDEIYNVEDNPYSGDFELNFNLDDIYFNSDDLGHGFFCSL